MSNQNKPVRVLCAGDVNGKFKQLINRVSAVNKKAGPFDILFCVGEFFGPDDLENQKVVDGDVQFPVPTYILGPCCPSTSSYYPEQGVEFSSSLTYLGKKGILNTANGLTVGYLSGIEISAPNPNAFQFNDDSVNELLTPLRANSSFVGLDILLTSIWPTEIWKHSTNQPTDQIQGSKLLSRLAAGLKPRYHFAGFGPHYERSPYRNHRVLLEPSQLVTRFIGLASVDNPKKEKWLYAFSITPLRKMEQAELIAQPPNTTEFPYMQILEEFYAKQREIEATNKNSGVQFFYDMDADLAEEDKVDRGGRRKRPWQGNNDSSSNQRTKVAFQPDACWFCLSNADDNKHLIVTIGTTCYAAMPKGPLCDDHLLIMSIGHVQSLAVASPEIRAEVEKFRDAFTLMCDKNNKVVCMFERNYKTAHLQVQLVPIGKNEAKALRSSFLNVARLQNIEFTFLKENEQVWDLVGEGCPYFYVELPDGTKMMTRSMSGFPIHFGREVLCGKGLLDMEEKIDWRNCALPKDAETELILKLKSAFKPFDFTQDSDDSDEE